MHRNSRNLAKPTKLVVVEDGATLPQNLARPDDGRELVVLAQARVSPTDLLLRVARTVASFERRGQSLERAVLVAGTRNDASSHSARCLVARSLARHLARSTQGELELVTSQHEASRRHELFTLAGVLTSAAPSHLTVSVRSETGEREKPLTNRELEYELLRRAV